MRRLHGILCIFCIWGISFPTSAQHTDDTLLIRQWIDTAWDIRYDDPARSALLSRYAVSASGDSYYFGALNGLQLIGEYHYAIGQLDSAVIYYRKALRYSQSEKDLREDGNNYTGLASILQDAGERDSALQYFRLAVRTFETLKDSSSLCDAWLRYAGVHSVMGHHDLAITSYLTSIRICEAISREEYVAYNYGGLGVVHDKQKNFDKAEEYFLKALAVFEKTGNVYAQMSTHNNLGILYKNMKAYEKSLDAYTRSLAFADSMNFDQGKMSSHTNIGILNVQMGFFENALFHSRSGLEWARKFQAKESISDNLNWIARAQLGLKELGKALENASEALRIAKEVQSLEKQREANLTLSDIYRALREFDLSLEYYEAYSTIKDSLFNTEKSKQILELQTLYETEKKDKEIQLLARQAELDTVRKTRLWIGLGLSLLAGGLLVYGQWIRSVRDRKILSQEKELEIQRRRTSELEKDRMSRELDLKKQELAAKALLLARKKEFLQTLNEEVVKMREQTEGAVADSARRISHHIRMDIESENDWDQFLSSFRDVHRDFIEGLQRVYPDLSKSEIRLACLMKMNLSAKEQAALLNITPDGIKKARYRLRKTMALDSEVDIQEFMLGFPPINP